MKNLHSVRRMCVLAFLWVACTESEACDESPWVYIPDSLRYRALAYYQAYPDDWEPFKALADDPDGCSSSYPPDCIQFFWSFSAGVTHNQPTGTGWCSSDGAYCSGVGCRFTSTGSHIIDVRATDDEGDGVIYSAIVRVFENDIDIAGVSDASEENPGGFVCKGGLIEVPLHFEASQFPGYVELVVADSWNVIVWKDSGRNEVLIDLWDYGCSWSPGSLPSAVYVEGWSPVAATLSLRYTNDGQNYSDTVNVIVKPKG